MRTTKRLLQVTSRALPALSPRAHPGPHVRPRGPDLANPFAHVEESADAKADL